MCPVFLFVILFGWFSQSNKRFCGSLQVYGYLLPVHLLLSLTAALEMLNRYLIVYLLFFFIFLFACDLFDLFTLSIPCMLAIFLARSFWCSLSFVLANSLDTEFLWILFFAAIYFRINFVFPLSLLLRFSRSRCIFIVLIYALTWWSQFQIVFISYFMKLIVFRSFLLSFSFSYSVCVWMLCFFVSILCLSFQWIISVLLVLYFIPNSVLIIKILLREDRHRIGFFKKILFVYRICTPLVLCCSLLCVYVLCCSEYQTIHVVIKCIS